ncbi:MAG: hypothetical protein ABJC39_07250 [Chloroflexota bacterium]
MAAGVDEVVEAGADGAPDAIGVVVAVLAHAAAMTDTMATPTAQVRIIVPSSAETGYRSRSSISRVILRPGRPTN